MGKYLWKMLALGQILCYYFIASVYDPDGLFSAAARRGFTAVEYAISGEHAQNNVRIAKRLYGH